MLKKDNHYPNGRYITREEFSQYIQMGEKEFKRINERLKIQESMEEKTYQLVSRMDKLANSLENLLKAFEKQEKRIDEHDVRLDHIDTKDSKKWENISEHIWKYIAAAIVGYVLFKAGIFQIP